MKVLVIPPVTVRVIVQKESSVTSPVKITVAVSKASAVGVARMEIAGGSVWETFVSIRILGPPLLSMNSAGYT